MSDLKFYTVEDVAEMFAVSKRTVLQWARQKKLIGKKPGGKNWVFTEQQIRDFVDNDANEANEES